MDVQLTPFTELTIVEKNTFNSWGKMGLKVKHVELALQLRAQESLKKLEVVPLTIEDVQSAEQILKEVKNELQQIIADRKAITSKFDPVFERLMIPEKSFAEAMAAYVSAIITIKKEEEKKIEDRRKKADELARIRQALITTQAYYDAEFKTQIVEWVGATFTKALEKDTKPGQECEDYMDRAKFKMKASYFPVEKPTLTKGIVTEAEFDNIYKEVWTIDPAVYVELFKTELDKKFAGYEVAYQNKQQALAMAKEEQALRLREIEEQKQHSTIAAELDAGATDLSVIEGGMLKALKKCYEVDMPENFENAMKIFSAFLVNKEKCLEKVNIKKWFNFDASSAAKALAKVKSDDNAFAPLGIIWKEVDKL